MALLFAAGLLIGWKIMRYRQRVADSRPLSLKNMGQAIMGVLERYREVRVKDTFGVIIIDFLLYVTTVKDIITRQELCKKIYDMEFEIQGQNIHIFYMFTLGTNAMTSNLYDLVHGSIWVKIKTFLFGVLPSSIFNVPIVVMVAIGSLVKASLYYLDICKDILIASLIYQKVMTSSEGFIMTGRWSLPTRMFLVFVSSVAATKICDLITLIRHPQFAMWTRTKKFLSIALWPFIPAFIYSEEVWYSYKLTNTANKIEASQDCKGEIYL